MITADQIKDTISELMLLSFGDLKKRIEDDKRSALERSLAKVIFRIAQDGDSQKLTAILDRAVGRVGDVNENTFDEDEETLSLSDDELVNLASQAK